MLETQKTEGYYLLNLKNQVVGWSLLPFEPPENQRLHPVSEPLPPEILEVEDKQDEAHALNAKKRELLAKLAQSAQQFAARLTGLDTVPAFEVETWVIQGREAKAWFLDPNAPTPVLKTIAAARGVPLDVLRQKAYEKTVQFELLTATLAGQRQYIESLILSADNLESLKALWQQSGFEFRGQSVKLPPLSPRPSIVAHFNTQSETNA